MAARSGLNVGIIQTMTFTQIMDIWRRGRSLEDHLNFHDDQYSASRKFRTLIPWIFCDPTGGGGQPLPKFKTFSIASGGIIYLCNIDRSVTKYVTHIFTARPSFFLLSTA